MNKPRISKGFDIYLHWPEKLINRFHPPKGMSTNLKAGDRVVMTMPMLWGINEPSIPKDASGVVLDIGREESYHKFLSCLVEFDTYRDKEGSPDIWVPASVLREELKRL